MAEAKPAVGAKDKKQTKSKAVKKAEVVAEVAPVEEAPKAEIEVEKPVAKAGKRSSKAQKEAGEKATKEARKSVGEAEKSTKTDKKPPKSRLERAGKKFRAAAGQIEAGKFYSLADAVNLAAQTSPTKFDATVEMHINLGVDPKISDQNIRATVVLPNGTGKTLRVAAVTEDDTAAKKAGADIAGVDNILSQLEKEQIDFDVLVATPQLMARLSKYARLLGPRGLMPNPKSGTVTTDIGKAISEAKAGKVEYRSDSAGIVHLGIGKVSLGADKLTQNAQTVVSSVQSARPSSLKGNYIKSIYLSTTMGPSIRTEIGQR